MQVTKQQRANLLEALNVMWPSVPPENVASLLSFWRTDKGVLPTRLGYPRGTPADCGTIACFGGWCAHWPTFQAQGVRPSESGAPLWKNATSPSTAAYKLFGDPALFMGRGGHEADHGFKNFGDHKLVTHRLEWVLARSVVMP